MCLRSQGSATGDAGHNREGRGTGAGDGQAKGQVHGCGGGKSERGKLRKILRVAAEGRKPQCCCPSGQHARGAGAGRRAGRAAEGVHALRGVYVRGTSGGHGRGAGGACTCIGHVRLAAKGSRSTRVGRNTDACRCCFRRAGGPAQRLAGAGWRRRKGGSAVVGRLAASQSPFGG